MIAAVAPRRFDVVLTGDSLRLGSAKDVDRCVVTLVPDDTADAAVRVFLPKEDRRAYARASRAFNRGGPARAAARAGPPRRRSST